MKSKSKKLVCILTGKSTLFSGEYLSKKIEEYGSEENLDKLYICKEAKAFLKKGYSFIETRKLLNVAEDEDLPNKDIIDLIEKDYQKGFKINDTANEIANATSFTYNKSDPDVEVFINTFIIGLNKK